MHRHCVHDTHPENACLPACMAIWAPALLQHHRHCCAEPEIHCTSCMNCKAFPETFLMTAIHFAPPFRISRLLHSPGAPSTQWIRLACWCELYIVDVGLPFPFLPFPWTDMELVVCRGVPVQEWSRLQVLVAYWGIGLWLGRVMPQNKKGHIIGHIKVGDRQLLLTHAQTVVCGTQCMNMPFLDHPQLRLLFSNTCF